MKNKYNINDEVFIIQSKWIYSEDNKMPLHIHYVNKKYKISEIAYDKLSETERIFYSFYELENGEVSVKEEYIFSDEFEAMKRCNTLNIQEIDSLKI